MTIPKITPYTGGVANPDGSQTQTEFTQNMFDQLSYEANLSTELNNTVDGINDTAIQVDADAISASQSASAAEAAVSGLDYQGLWPDTGGNANKGETYQTQTGGAPSGQYFTALQNTTVTPVGDNVNWRSVVSFSSFSNPNLISNSSFEVAGSVTSPPDATPRSYSSGDELFQGFKAVGALSGVTYVNGKLNGTGQLYVDVYKTEKQKLSTSQYIASIASSDGLPVESGASINDAGDYWRVTFDMSDTFSVKLQIGGVADKHNVGVKTASYSPYLNKMPVNLDSIVRNGEVLLQSHGIVDQGVTRDQSVNINSLLNEIASESFSVTVNPEYAPGGIYLENTIVIPDGVEYSGMGRGSYHIFHGNYPSDPDQNTTNDCFRIIGKNSKLSNVAIDGDASEETTGPALVAMRNGAIDSEISNVWCRFAASSSFVFEEVEDCKAFNIYSYRNKRHAAYLIASQGMDVSSFKFKESKLQPVVLRGKITGGVVRDISGYRVKNGIIDGFHPETSAFWNAVTLAQHPNQGDGEFYSYSDIIIESIKCRNPFTGAGYGNFFSNNGEPLTDSKFLTNRMYGGNTMLDLRKCSYVEAVDNVSQGANGTPFTIDNCNDLTLTRQRAKNPNSNTSSAFAAGMNISNSNNVSIDGLACLDFRGTPLMKYGLRVTNSINVKNKNSSIAGAVTKTIDVDTPENFVNGNQILTASFTASNLTAGHASRSSR